MSTASVAIKKVVLIGPESSGKSTLCEKLANHYDVVFVKEYARTYLNHNGADYSHEDLIQIAKGQLLEEKKAKAKINLQADSDKPKLLFVDTDFYVIKIWSELVFGRCETHILNELAANNCSLYLLCEPDIPWIEDPLRAHPDHAIRMLHYHHYKDAMVNQHIRWENINGDFASRWEKAQSAVDALFQ
jgi:NadR type nicotinamide-nucleotide adenylyltransferase